MQSITGFRYKALLFLVFEDTLTDISVLGDKLITSLDDINTIVNKDYLYNLITLIGIYPTIKVIFVGKLTRVLNESLLQDWIKKNYLHNHAIIANKPTEISIRYYNNGEYTNEDLIDEQINNIEYQYDNSYSIVVGDSKLLKLRPDMIVGKLNRLTINEIVERLWWYR